MATSTRIYIVTSTDGATRLIKATVASQAITHAAKQSFTARVASQDDLVQALSNGVKVETYGESVQGELIND
jgi:hypothetical protein